MHRVLYVPTEIEIDESISTEANLLGLPILHGESALSRFVEFDRAITQVIAIPSEKLCLYQQNVEFPLHQSIEVTNDFIDFRDDVVFVLNGSKIVEPLILEKHYARYAIETKGLGLQVFDIFDKSMQVIEHGEYYVVNPE